MVKHRDKREGSVHFDWDSDRDQIEEQLNATLKEHFDTSAEIPEQAPEEGANPSEEEEVRPGCKKVPFPLDFQSVNSSGRGRGHGRGRDVLGKGASGRFLSRTVLGNGLFRGREGREDGGRLLVAGRGVTLAV